ncbi:DUF4998 domain-containing protein [Chitinophaga tropicalis]|uniref:DUF5013 domain-containing protein n=1 Tax=Chitinophaga tropicalis TaxID=2683588 RepID=A0A7K1U506_9BACT|nr:DUF4998 domain-containing protein [Chitinophaga tropicalis]MVT09366.1 DUF5013 domain-containing protein [Chitinophaga tropicalis]
MPSQNNNKRSLLLLLVMGLVAVMSCTKEDEYKKYITNGSEIRYTGKLDSMEIRSGYNRVEVSGLFMGDPNVASCKIYWDSRRDSVTLLVKRTSGVDTLRHIISGLSEGSHSFEIVTFDMSGNHSVSVKGSGYVYGDRYKGALLNRPVTSAELDAEGNAVITWGDFDITSGARGTIHTYTNNSNETVSVYAPVQQTTTKLPGYKAGTRYDYKTVYLPDSSAIDTFYSASDNQGVKANITATYIKNAGPPFLASSSGGRWGIPADWTVNADVKNAGGYGGLDAGSWLPSAALSMEAGWGLPAVPNGKIYQTFTLPAGKYAFEVVTGDCSDSPTTKYISVAKGASLPDIDNVATEALQYITISKYTTNKLQFELTEATQISIGFQAKLPDTGTFFKVFNVKLYSMP